MKLLVNALVFTITLIVLWSAIIAFAVLVAMFVDWAVEQVWPALLLSAALFGCFALIVRSSK